MTDDDWQPLPAEQWGHHPGEFAPEPRRVVPAPRERDPDPVDLAAAAEAERALAALKARIAEAGPSRSLIAEVQHGEQRRAAKRKNVERAVARAETQIHREVNRPASTTAEPSLEIDARAADIDPRETEPWFAELPKKEQERLKTHWWYERHRNDGAGTKLRRRIGRAVGYGALLFFVMSLLLVMLLGGFSYVPLLTAAGALAAGVAEVCGGGRIRYGIAGAAAFVLVLGPQVFLQPLAMIALMLLTYAMATLGMDGEMRQSGGFGDR